MYDEIIIDDVVQFDKSIENRKMNVNICVLRMLTRMDIVGTCGVMNGNCKMRKLSVIHVISRDKNNNKSM